MSSNLSVDEYARAVGVLEEMATKHGGHHRSRYDLKGQSHRYDKFTVECGRGQAIAMATECVAVGLALDAWVEFTPIWNDKVMVEVRIARNAYPSEIVEEQRRQEAVAREAITNRELAEVRAERTGVPA